MKHICINDITGEAKSTKAQSYTREHLWVIFIRFLKFNSAQLIIKEPLIAAPDTDHRLEPWCS